MKKLIQTSVIVVVLAAQVEPAIAGQKKITDYFRSTGAGSSAPSPALSTKVKGQTRITDYFRPSTRMATVTAVAEVSHPSTPVVAAAPAPAPEPASMTHNQMGDPLAVIAEYLDPVSLARFSQTHRNARDAVKVVQAQAFKREFAKVNLLTLPGVWQVDVEHLQRAGAETSIRAPRRSFKISDTPITIGLYHSVMGHYPDLSRSDWPAYPEQRNALRARWQANPDLPLTNTTVAEDQAFIAALNARTGRHFRLPTESELEYSIRGRAQGIGWRAQITTTRYHFGDDYGEVPNRAWVSSNSGGQAHGVREALPGRTLEDSKNSFGLIHAIGNVWVRSAEGAVRGGSFDSTFDHARSSFRSIDSAVRFRLPNIGARLVEDL